jgi:signal transduction histidine kinase
MKNKKTFFLLIFALLCGIKTLFPQDAPFIKLQGNWQYHYGGIDKKGGQYWYSEVNGSSFDWKSIGYPDKVLSDTGDQELWMRVKLPERTGYDNAIYIRLVRGIIEAYLDTNKLYSTGDFNSRGRIGVKGWSWHLIKLPDNFKGKTLYLHIKADHKRPGIVGDVLLGAESDIIGNIFQKNFFISALGLLFIASGIIFLLVLILLKEVKLYGGLIILQLSIGVWNLTISPLSQLLIDAPRSLYFVSHMAMFISAIGLYLLAKAILAPVYKKAINLMAWLMVAYSVIMVFIDQVLEPSHMYIVLPYFYSMVVGVFILMYLSYKSYKRVQQESRIFIITLNFYMMFIILEFLRYALYWFFNAGAGNANILIMGEFISFLILCWVIITRYVQMNKKVISSQENERLRIARDLHDEIGPRLTEIKMASEIIKSQSSGQFADYKLNELGSSVDSLVSTFSEIIWALNPSNNTLEELGTYLGQCSVDFLGKAGIRCRLSIPPVFPDLKISYDTRRDIVMSVKEWLNNIVKHSWATIVTVEMKFDGINFFTTIADDGCGFNPENIRSGGNGLKNIHYRIEKAGGSAKIETAPAKGSSLMFSVPINM